MTLTLTLTCIASVTPFQAGPEILYGPATSNGTACTSTMLTHHSEVIEGWARKAAP